MAQIAQSRGGRASSPPLGGGVVGTDLTYDSDAGRWVGDPTVSHDTVVKR